MSTALRGPSAKEQASVSPGRKQAMPPAHAPWRHFARHYLEMAAVMGLGIWQCWRSPSCAREVMLPT